MMFNRRLTVLSLCMALLPAAAMAQTKIKMVLNWKYEGPQAWFFLAQDKGYFKEEGLDVEFDQGEDLLTRLVPAEAAARLVADGRIGHSLVVVAFFYFELWRRGLKQTET